MTENSSMVFLHWKAASVPVQRCSQVDMAASTGDGGGDREQAQKGQMHEVTLNPRALQDQVKRVEIASE